MALTTDISLYTFVVSVIGLFSLATSLLLLYSITRWLTQPRIRIVDGIGRHYTNSDSKCKSTALLFALLFVGLALTVYIMAARVVLSEVSDANDYNARVVNVTRNCTVLNVTYDPHPKAKQTIATISYASPNGTEAPDGSYEVICDLGEYCAVPVGYPVECWYAGPGLAYTIHSPAIDVYYIVKHYRQLVTAAAFCCIICVLYPCFYCCMQIQWEKHWQMHPPNRGELVAENIGWCDWLIVLAAAVTRCCAHVYKWCVMNHERRSLPDGPSNGSSSLPENQPSTIQLNSGAIIVPNNRVHIADIQLDANANPIRTVARIAEFQCAICLSAIPEYIFVKCGHFCMCAGCSVQYTEKKCIICKTESPVIRVFPNVREMAQPIAPESVV